MAPTYPRMVKVCDLKPGQFVDLAGDPYADPDGDHPEYESEFAVVEERVYETDFCALVHFESTPSVGFPPDHEVKVTGSLRREREESGYLVQTAAERRASKEGR